MEARKTVLARPQSFKDEVEDGLKAVGAGVEGEDLGDELDGEKGEEKEVVGVPGGSEGDGELVEVELAGAEEQEEMAGDGEDVEEEQAVEDEVDDAAGAGFALELGFEGWEFGGVPGESEGLGVVAGVDEFGDGEADGDPEGEGDDIRDELAEADEDGGD